ncbi:MAG: hypothetical protein U1E02_15235, partial [Hydrogenophaga sp.]|nr:hypothetical protein [Hydrogenophaga sp.]
CITGEFMGEAPEFVKRQAQETPTAAGRWGWRAAGRRSCAKKTVGARGCSTGCGCSTKEKGGWVNPILIRVSASCLDFKKAPGQLPASYMQNQHNLMLADHGLAVDPSKVLSPYAMPP